MMQLKSTGEKEMKISKERFIKVFWDNQPNGKNGILLQMQSVFSKR